MRTALKWHILPAILRSTVFSGACIAPSDRPSSETASEAVCTSQECELASTVATKPSQNKAAFTSGMSQLCVGQSLIEDGDLSEADL